MENPEIVSFDDPKELLYLRVDKDDVEGAAVLEAAVAIPDWSMNRSRFSKPADVLDSVRYPTQTRVAQLVVGDIPQVIEPDAPSSGEASPKPWCFWAEHCPTINDPKGLPDNYAHSEVRMKPKDGEYKRHQKPSSGVYKKKIRNELAKLLTVLDNVEPN